MKILVLGATGMLGHKLMQVLSNKHDVFGTIRGKSSIYETYPVLSGLSLISETHAEDFDSIITALAESQPDVVINCIGIIKQNPLSNDPLYSIKINSLFPHRLQRLCKSTGARMIHISTDCVFSGRKGYYSESDKSDAEDLYGRTKFLGEVSEPGSLTIRTSIIGRELQGKYGLLEWFLGNKGGRVQGYANAIFTGFTSLALANIIENMIKFHPDLHGIWHISSAPISKFDLLMLINQKMDLHIVVDRNDNFRCDRSLNSDHFRKATGFIPPSWEEMIAEMARDNNIYLEDD
ncbi:MAG: dTDP-4-dehydrorhamnose reductase family protein [Methanothrix sp.]